MIATTMPALDPTRACAGTAVLSSLELGIVTDRDGLAAIRADWIDLAARCGLPQQVFQDHDWLSIWSRHYLDGRTGLLVVTGRREGRLALVWPLAWRSVLGLRVLSFMGEPVSQYGDAIVDRTLSDADLNKAFDYVAALPAAVLALRRVRADAAIEPLLRRRLGPPANIQHAPYIDFGGIADVETFQRRYPGKSRSSRRRHLRRLEEQGAVRFAHHGPSAEAEVLVARAIGFKRAWARQTGAVAAAIKDPRFERFFRAAASGEGPCPALRVSVVTCADTVAGVEISVACKGRLFGHVLAPSPDFARFGLGGLLAGQAILSACEQGYAIYDTLAPADSYKRQWTDALVEIGDYTAGRGLVGRLYAGLWPIYGRAAAKWLLKTMGRGRSRLNALRTAAAAIGRPDDAR